MKKQTKAPTLFFHIFPITLAITFGVEMVMEGTTPVAALTKSIFIGALVYGVYMGVHFFMERKNK